MSTLSPLHRQNLDKIVPEDFRPPAVTIPPEIRVGSVPYLNAKPLTRCIASTVSLLEPSRLAADLRAGHLDVGLVPIMEVLEAPPGLYRVVNGAAIGSERDVYSVYLNYTGALGNIQTVALDPASKTSVELTRIVLEKFHRLKPRYVSPDEPADAQLLIGDPAIIHRQANPDQKYLDLGGAWREQTGLPFVFAVWALRLTWWRARGVAGQLRRAKETGVAHANFIARNVFERAYLNEHLCYDLGARQKQAIAKFAELLVELERLPREPKLRFI
jgi:predicted solute-binding protein